MTRLFAIIAITTCLASGARAAESAAELFRRGTQAYVAGGFEQAAISLREAAVLSPSPGTLRNLGNAEWQSGHPGSAILAWERAQWTNPFDRDISANLRFARKSAQLDAPELAWYEICSTWLPVNWWPWLACASFWLAAVMILVPGVFRWQRAGWHQGVAAAGFAVFLLTIPALAGVQTRSQSGIILAKETPLRLTPTTEAQTLTKLPAGETARLERKHGDYVFIRTTTVAGWVEGKQFGLISANP